MAECYCAVGSMMPAYVAKKISEYMNMYIHIYRYVLHILNLGNAAMLLILLDNSLLQRNIEDLVLIILAKVTTYWLFHCDFRPQWCGRSLLGFLGICIVFAELFGFTLSC